MAEFKPFADALNTRLTTMSKGELFVVGDDKDLLWTTYLESFPEGTNPMFRQRTEHDDSCCRQFVRGFGNVVEIVDGQVRTVWGERYEMFWTTDFGDNYDVVAGKMDEYVRSLPLTGIFRASERQYGAQVSRSLKDGVVETWSHFHAKVANKHYTKEVGTVRGEFDAAVQVFARGLEELSPSAVETVVDLIDSNSLYRGEEHLAAVTAFRSLQNKYHQIKFYRTLGRPFVYANASSPAARFRNTVIGTLVQDLSSGVDLESAVRSFESKVAPLNYKRPKSIITPAMVKSAMKTIEELGIERSLERRFARLSDVSVNNVLWVGNDTQALMKDGIEGLLMSAATTTSRKPKGEPEKVSIASFMKDILPGASEVELLVKNSHEPNFVSITTGQHSDAPRLFKWDNPFGWSYNGGATDSIKEKVKRAGGNVTGKLRVSLSWFNYDDLDIHVNEPNGNHIWYGSKQGKLDVDMNAGGGTTREPVENVSWASHVQDGDYKVTVHQYSQRENSDVGFTIETESNGVVEQFSYDKAVRGTVEVGTMTVQAGVITAFKPGKGIVGGSASKKVWGITTEEFIPVRTVLHSPNHWNDSAVGNLHYLFILRDCINDQPTRGIFGEYLRGDLHQKHGKVFEVLSDRTRVQPSDEQLSGVGFSSTAGGTVVARAVVGSRQRLLDIQF